MTIEIRKISDTATIAVEGRLDTNTSPRLDKAIHEELSDVKHLTLDFKGLEYISSAGLRVLLSAQKKLQKIGSMTVMNVCEDVMEVFEITGFSDILVIE